MKRILCAFVTFAFLSTGCEGVTLVDDFFTEAEWQAIQKLSPLPALPPNTTNAFADNAAAAALGQKFFFETDWSGPMLEDNDLGLMGETGKISCMNACHSVTTPWLTDRVALNPKVPSTATGMIPRNSVPLVNAVYYPGFSWTSALDSAWTQSLLPTEEAHHNAADRMAVVHIIHAKYKDEYNAVFTGDPLDDRTLDALRFPAHATPFPLSADAAYNTAWDGMTAADQDYVTRAFVNYAKALEAYFRLLVSENAPFDQYVAGDTSALTLAQKRGLKLFVGRAGCIGCHSGPMFSDFEAHVTGVPAVFGDSAGLQGDIPVVVNVAINTDSVYSDDTTTGRVARLQSLTGTLGAFRTQGLRGIAETAPFMHSGAYETLADVIDFYDRGGESSGFDGDLDILMVPLNLSAQQKSDLVEFLESLSGDPLPANLLLDTSNP